MVYFNDNPLRFESEYYADFQGAVTETGLAATVNGTGAAAALKATGTQNHPGVAELTAGTTTSGRAALTANITDWFVGSSNILTMEALFQLPDLSVVAEEYSIWIGFGDTATTHDQVDGIYLYYDRVNDGDNFFIASANNSTRTEVDTQVAVAADTWYRLRIGIASNDSTPTAYYDLSIADATGNTSNIPQDGKAVGTITTNLPSTAARAFGRSMGILKSAGTTARTLEIDYIYTKNIPAKNR